MDRHYTILLDRGGRFPAQNGREKIGFDQSLDSTSRLMADPPRPAVHRERLTANEIRELAREPEFVAAAEVMKTRLLSPVAESEVVEEAPPTGMHRRQSWGIAAVGADQSKFTGAGVTVALLDTGIDAEHQAFRGIDLVEKDFTGYGNGDLDGHGTHCAGVIFGRNVDRHRIGVAPGVRRALIGKIIGPKGGDSDMLIRALAWAHDENARVISLSVGLDFAATVDDWMAAGWPRDLATTAALEAYRANLRLLERMMQMFQMQEPCTGGAVIVAAAGNDSSRGVDSELIMAACPPAGIGKIIAVASLDPASTGSGYRVSNFSNTGVEIAAPGRGVISARVGGGMRTLSGTSAAAPHAAGVAALWWQAIRQSDLPANATLVRGKLISGAESRNLSRATYPAERGAGLVTAPQDGVAVSLHEPAPRGPWREEAIGGAIAFGGQRGGFGQGLEPINVGGDREHEDWLRQRREPLC